MITEKDKIMCAITAVSGIGMLAWFGEAWIVDALIEWIGKLSLSETPTTFIGDMMFWLVQMSFLAATLSFYRSELVRLERHRKLIICQH